MKDSIFKAYDIRGVYPEDINEEGAYIIGKSYGTYINKVYGESKCVVGQDNRLSSPSLAKSLIQGILDSGVDVIDYGVVTTPMHFLSRRVEKCLGITVTASHNPKDDNGYKFSFDRLSNARGQLIYDFRDFTKAEIFNEGKGKYIQKSIKEDFLNYFKKNIDMGNKKLSIVVDPGNGTGTIICKECFSLFPNLDVTYICDENDGNFPNHHPDPAVEKNLDMLKAKVLEINADLGIGIDGDADRIGFINNIGEFVTADEFMIIVARAIMPTLKNKTILYDVKCSKALEDEINKLGGNPYCYRTGASYSDAEVKLKNIGFGGEFSGHIFFNDRDESLGCGIYAGLRMVEILSKTDKKMSELLEGINKYISTPEIKITTTNEAKFEIVSKVLEYVKQKGYDYIDLDGVRVNFEDGWGLIRASNTGPDLTSRFEGKDEVALNRIKNEFETVLNSIIKES